MCNYIKVNKDNGNLCISASTALQNDIPLLEADFNSNKISINGDFYINNSKYNPLENNSIENNAIGNNSIGNNSIEKKNL